MTQSPHEDKTRLDDQVAIVTGAGGGIGRGIALALAAKGATLVIVDIVRTRCEEVSARIAEAGGRAVPTCLDMTDAGAVRAMVDEVGTRLGRLDILVNNVGGVRSRPFLEQSERSWHRHININLISTLTATQAAAPIMIRGQRGGSIVNITSIEGARAAPGCAVYAACKAGINNLTRTLALELSQHQIRVNAIAPDQTDSPGTMGNPADGPVDPTTWIQHDEATQNAIERRIPLLRTGLAEECGDAAVFLCSRMSKYITGVILPVDGGTWASSGWVRTPQGAWTLNQGAPILI
jgi:NAD(P)-dependent dehydrogenase (short-subunit alcohol dehydrogenase family)